jgi:phage gp29-like protein
MSWAPRLWDLGAIHNWDFLRTDVSTSAGFGVDFAEFPNKFIIHAPQYRGDYPTRDGVGRETALMSALKLMGLRSVSQYIERFAKPWSLATFSTSDTGTPRIAGKEDIAKADAAIKALGTGNAASATIPDSIKVALLGPGAQSTGNGKLQQSEFIQLCNAETSKAVLGNSDSVETGPNGSRSSTGERMKGQRAIYKYDAACLGDTLTRDLSLAWTRLNYPGKEHLRPLIIIHIEEEMTPQEIMSLAKDGVSIGMPLDADKLAGDVGLTNIAADATEGRICRPLANVTNPETLDVAYVPPEPPTLPTVPTAPVDATEPQPDVIDGAKED